VVLTTCQETAVVGGSACPDRYHFESTWTSYSRILASLARRPASGSPRGIFSLGRNFSKRPVWYGPFFLESWIRHLKIHVFESNPDLLRGNTFSERASNPDFSRSELQRKLIRIRDGKLDLSFVPPRSISEAKKTQMDLFQPPVLRFLYLD